MAQQIDLVKHFRDTMILHVKDHYGSRFQDGAIEEVQYGEMQFTGAINYHLDNWNPSTELDTIDEIEENNNTPNPQTVHIKRIEKVTNSYTWSSQHSVSVGVTVSASFNVPFVGGVDTSISTEYSYTSSESTTETKERSWEFLKDIVVSPYSKLTALLMIEKTIPRVPYDMEGAFTGILTGEGKVKMDGQWRSLTVKLPIPFIFEKQPLPNFDIAGDTVYFRTSGVFTASEGIKAIIDLNEEPLDQPGKVSKHWTIDMRPEPQFQIPGLSQFLQGATVEAD